MAPEASLLTEALRDVDRAVDRLLKMIDETPQATEPLRFVLAAQEKLARALRFPARDLVERPLPEIQRHVDG